MRVMADLILRTDESAIHVLAPGQGSTRTARFCAYAVDLTTHAGRGLPAAARRIPDLM